MSSSPNFDPRIQISSEIDYLIKGLDNYSETEIHQKITKIIEGIENLGNKVDLASYEKIRALRDKLQEFKNGEEAQRLNTLIKHVAARAMPTDVYKEIFEFRSPRELLHETKISKATRSLAIEVAIDKINKDKVPLADLWLNDSELYSFIRMYGNKIEYLDFSGMIDFVFRNFIFVWVGCKIGAGEAEFFEEDDGAFSTEGEALFFGADGCDGFEVGVGGEFVEKEPLDDEVGVAADGAGEVAIVLEGETIVAKVFGGVGG
jgi:hypothetical protein